MEWIKVEHEHVVGEFFARIEPNGDNDYQWEFVAVNGADVFHGNEFLDESYHTDELDSLSALQLALYVMGLHYSGIGEWEHFTMEADELQAFKKENNLPI